MKGEGQDVRELRWPWEKMKGWMVAAEEGSEGDGDGICADGGGCDWLWMTAIVIGLRSMTGVFKHGKGFISVNLERADQVRWWHALTTSFMTLAQCRAAEGKIGSPWKFAAWKMGEQFFFDEWSGAWDEGDIGRLGRRNFLLVVMCVIFVSEARKPFCGTYAFFLLPSPFRLSPKRVNSPFAFPLSFLHISTRTNIAKLPEIIHLKSQTWCTIKIKSLRIWASLL